MTAHTQKLRAQGKTHHPGLSERLTALRLALGLSQQVLAVRAGISVPRLRDAEGFGLATVSTLRLLAAQLGVTVDHLRGRSGLDRAKP